MKTKEELNAIKEEVETLNKKLAELSEEELEQVRGGGVDGMYKVYYKQLRMEEDESPACYASQENLNVAKPQGCAACEYYESCYNPDKA